jgi:hypothetical protein
VVYSEKKKKCPEAEFLDVIGTKVLRVPPPPGAKVI